MFDAWAAWSASAPGRFAIEAGGLAITILGFVIALWGLKLTYEKAQKAATAAHAAENAVNAFKLRIDQYSVYRDLGEATLAIETTRKHLMKPTSWADACDSYEIALRAAVRVQQSEMTFDEGLADDFDKMVVHMQRFCDRVDAAEAGKAQYPDEAKVLSAIRQNHAILSAAKAAVEKEV